MDQRQSGESRSVLEKLKDALRSHEYLRLCYRLAKATLRHGPGHAMKMKEIYLAEIRQRRRMRREAAASGTWPDAGEIERLQKERFPRDITFSILVPLYNTPVAYLKDMLDSVRNQAYVKWELCLADGSDAAHGDVGRICEDCARQDARIRYRKLEENLGISENTNRCLEMAGGDYIALFDHDDILHPMALYEYMKAICEKDADFLYSDENTFHQTPSDAYWPHYKPDYAPDTLRSYNYICHFTAFRASLLEEIGGGFRPRFDGSQDYDLILRLTEKAKTIVHVPKVLYYWRSHPDSTASDIASKPYTMDAARAALSEHLARVGLRGTVVNAAIPSTYRIQYALDGQPLISIIIPNKDHVDDLRKCLKSILDKSTYPNWEILIVENNSTRRETFDYYETLASHPRIRVLKWDREFNYSAINNFGAGQAKGQYLLLLNNDTEVISPDWMEQLLMFCQRRDVGAAGAMLYYPDDTVQHAGLILGVLGVAGHAHRYFRRGDYGYASRLAIAQNLSCVTAACVMIPRRVWDEVGGLDESFAVAFNDVDLCMRIRKAGYLIVWTPYAELYHYESKSRGAEDSRQKKARFEGETARFRERWRAELIAGDPYYNPNLTLQREDFSHRADDL